MIAQKCLIPNIPRLEIVKDPTFRSAGVSLLALALPASSLTLAEIPCSPSVSTFATTGVSRPDSVCTATLMSTLSYCRMNVSIQEALSSGTSRRARADALITKSLTEILYAPSPEALICARVLHRGDDAAKRRRNEYSRRNQFMTRDFAGGVFEH